MYTYNQRNNYIQYSFNIPKIPTNSRMSHEWGNEGFIIVV
jgi:hypothetical protein